MPLNFKCKLACDDDSSCHFEPFAKTQPSGLQGVTTAKISNICHKDLVILSFRWKAKNPRFENFAILYIRRKISQVPFCQVAKFHPLEKSPFENFCVPFFKPQIFARPNSSQITIFQHFKSPFSRHIFAQNSLKILQIQP